MKIWLGEETNIYSWFLYFGFLGIAILKNKLERHIALGREEAEGNPIYCFLACLQTDVFRNVSRSD